MTDNMTPELTLDPNTAAAAETVVLGSSVSSGVMLSVKLTLDPQHRCRRRDSAAADADA